MESRCDFFDSYPLFGMDNLERNRPRRRSNTRTVTSRTRRLEGVFGVRENAGVVHSMRGIKVEISDVSSRYLLRPDGQRSVCFPRKLIVVFGPSSILVSPTMSVGTSPNIRKIAKAARVSHTTVSMALRNHPRVSEQTKNRVLALAEKMGYRPNPLVAALLSHVRTSRRIVAQEVIAYFTAGPNRDWWKQWPCAANSFVGAQTRAEQLGFRLEHFWIGPGGVEAASVSKVLRARAIRGGIMAPLPLPHCEEIALDWANCAITAIGYSFNAVQLNRAAHNHVKSIMSLYEELRKLGYHRIGFSTGIDDLVRVRHFWLAGWLAGRELFGGAQLPYFVFDGADGKSRFFSWMKEEKPDVIVSIGKATYRWLKEEGVRLPQDVAFAHLNLRDVEGDKVAGIEQNSLGIGAAAVELLATQLYHNEYGVPKTSLCTLFDGFWVPGPTAPGR